MATRGRGGERDGNHERRRSLKRERDEHSRGRWGERDDNHECDEHSREGERKEIDKLKREIERLKQENKELVESNTRLEKSREKAREKVKELKKTVKTLEESSNEDYDKFQSRRGTPLSEVIEGIRHIFAPIQSDKDHTVLWYQPDRSLRLYSRDVLGTIIDRWSKNKPIPVLDKRAIEIRDGKPIIIGDGERTDYAKQFSNFLVSVFGDDHPDREMKNLIQYLEDENMNMSHFKRLYSHSFLQSWEEKAAFPALACQALKDHGDIKVGEKQYKEWTDCYNSWMNNRYGIQQGYNLESQCANDNLVQSVFNHGGYNNERSEEIRLLRNMMFHYREYSNVINLRQIGRAVYTCFPNIGFDLFDFFVKYGINVDFYGYWSL